jgi:hypothetical protein
LFHIVFRFKQACTSHCLQFSDAPPLNAQFQLLAHRSAREKVETKRELCVKAIERIRLKRGTDA